MIYRRLHPILHRFMAPAGEGDDLSAADRGDDWTPNDGDAAELKAAAEKAEADKKAAEDKAAADKKAAEDKAAEDKAAAEKGEGDKKDDKDGKKDTRIPLSRHKELLDKARERAEALERENATLKASQVVAKTSDDIAKVEANVATMEKDYLKLLADGKVDEAAAKMREIRTAERGIITATSALEIQAAEARAYERVKYDTTVERLEAAFPVINPDDEANYDKEKTAEVIELRDAFMATGKYTRADALQKACKTLLKPSTAKQESAVEVDVRVDKDAVAKAAADERKKAAVEKALETDKKQPPNTANVGSDSDKSGGVLKATDVIKMDQTAFKKLTDADLSRMRGDEI